MDDKQLERNVTDGNEAQKILKHPVFAGAVIAIKARLVQSFEETTFKEKDERDEIWRKLQALKYIEQELHNVITTGKFSEQSLLEKLGLKKGSA